VKVLLVLGQLIKTANEAALLWPRIRSWSDPGLLSTMHPRK
jgi:hypothetical protein